jgi:N12 class adenine-specific DNA methylase
VRFDFGPRNSAGMTTAELKKTRVSDEEVIAWRVEQLMRAGSDQACAVILARRGHVDLHEAVDLLERGCPPKTALEILL